MFPSTKKLFEETSVTSFSLETVHVHVFMVLFLLVCLFVCFDIMQTREIGCIYWIFPIGNSIK